LATETVIPQLIRTKLYPPRITGHLVPRPRLLRHLEARRGRPLTLVSAPAGYGKTTLVINWLDTCDCRSAWFSLDADLRIIYSWVPEVDERSRYLTTHAHQTTLASAPAGYGKSTLIASWLELVDWPTA
jgi:ATP/maltotriose-dependent transcriptional regulator MalT